MIKYFKINEDFDQIMSRTLKQKFGISEIKKIELNSTGWTNIVYKAYTNSGNYYFRFPRDYFWEKTIIKDYEFAKFINGKTSFKTSELVLAYDKDRPFSVHKEIPGTPLAEVMDTLSEDDVNKISNQIAQFLYELHSIECKKYKIFTINNVGLELNDFVTELLDKHVSNEDKSFWKTYNFCLKANDEKCLVHGDFNSSNVLLDENNNVKAIIDFGFAGYGNKYFDISRIIGRCSSNFKDAIIKSYEKYENKKIDLKELYKNIKIWNKIDSGYINYMKKIGIYE